MRPSIVLELLGGAVVVAAAILYGSQDWGSAAAAAHPHWRIVDLGVLPGARSAPTVLPGSYPTALDGCGDVVGGSSAPNTGTHAFLWRRGRMTDLGTLGGYNSLATAIDGRRIAGWADTRARGRHAVVWIDGRIHDLGTAGRRHSEATGFDSQGNVVGVAYDDPSMTGRRERVRRVVWPGRANRPPHLPMLPGVRPGPLVLYQQTSANACGTIAGIGTTRSGARHAVLWVYR